NEFLEDLSDFPLPSIDAFLEMRQHDPMKMKVGKAVIAVLMGYKLQTGIVKPTDPEDWLAYVIEKMAAGAPTFAAFDRGNCNVRFVTFNFDTTLENQLCRAILSIYREGSFPSDRVIHVHGKLPAVPSNTVKAD